MDALAGVSFGSREMLWLLIALPLVAIFLVARERLRRRLAERFVAERLRGIANTARAARPYFLAIALALTVAALARPQLGFEIRSVATPQTNLIIALDVSESMAARDAGTTRLSLAKAIARRLIGGTAEKTGLVIFEGTAETISPLTTDRDAVVSLLDTINTGDLDEPGTDVGAAVEKALKLTQTVASQSTEVVIISDGEDQGMRIDQSIAKAKLRNARFSTILVGSTAGTTIPTSSGPLKDESGETVITRADPATLAKIATATGGRFYDNPSSDAVLTSLQRDLAIGLAAGTHKSESRVPVERFQWPLSAAVMLFFAASLTNRGAE